MIACLAAAPLATRAATAPQVDPALFGALQWRGIGPFRGGRSLAVVGVPSQPGVFYFGAAAGGVWRSADYGGTWKPISDAAKITSIGAIAVAASNPSVIYVGTGEGALRGDITYGNGVYKSVDGGKNWTHVGLEDSRQIGAIVVDPHNPDIALVAALGHAFGPSPQRGVFRTADGGKTWARVLYRNDGTGAIDVTFDPSNAKIVYAALWQVRRQPWNFSSGGPGSGLFRSTDGGVTWTELKGHGLPGGILGRIDVSVSPADPKRVYAMIEAKDGGLYRSDDHGANWKLVNQDGRVRQRAWYFSKITTDPKSADTVYAVNTGLLRSTDGGRSFNLVPATHGDHHLLWIDPTNARHMIDANDGGASVSLDNGDTWSTQNNQPTGAFYHIAADNRFPYWLYGAQQDNTNLAVATYDDQGVIDAADWYVAGGGECGFVIPDPRDPQIIMSNSENSISRLDRHSMQAQDISAFPVDNSGHPAGELPHRFNWTSPLMLSPHNPDALYVASEVVWKTTDHGHSWAIISPDLTRNDKSKQTASGGPLTKDITSVEYYDTVFALAESPVKQGMLWAGADDGLIHLSNDDGAHWNDVTPDAMKPGSGDKQWSTISMIEPSHFDANVAYVAVDRHKLDDIAPYALKTTDAGAHWTAIAAGLPAGAVMHAVREDPARRGLLYAGTELGVFVSFDDGANWQKLQLNLPVTPVHDLMVKGDDLAIATHGRGFWILDDITPLRQIGNNTPTADVRLYTPQKALRLYYPDDVDSRRPVGQNPPAGALIDYYLKSAATGELTVDILDSTGKTVRHLSSTHSDKQVQPPEWPDRIVRVDTIPAKAGMNRLVWDLRASDPAQIPGAFYSDQAPRGPIVAPGQYQVKLTVNGVSQTAPLSVVADPRRPGSDADIQAKTALAIATTQDIDTLHRTVNAVRAAKTELLRVKHGVGTCDAAKPTLAAVDALSQQLDGVEQTLMQVNMKGSEANLAFPGMLNEQYATFQLTLGDADTPLTTQHQAMYDSLHKRLAVELATWQQLQNGSLAQFNGQLKQSGLCPVNSKA